MDTEATLLLTDDDTGEPWEWYEDDVPEVPPTCTLADFLVINEGDDDSCDAVRALAVGESVVIGLGCRVTRIL